MAIYGFNKFDESLVINARNPLTVYAEIVTNNFLNLIVLKDKDDNVVYRYDTVINEVVFYDPDDAKAMFVWKLSTVKRTNWLPPITLTTSKLVRRSITSAKRNDTLFFVSDIMYVNMKAIGMYGPMYSFSTTDTNYGPFSFGPTIIEEWIVDNEDGPDYSFTKGLFDFRSEVWALREKYDQRMENIVYGYGSRGFSLYMLDKPEQVAEIINILNGYSYDAIETMSRWKGSTATEVYEYHKEHFPDE